MNQSLVDIAPTPVAIPTAPPFTLAHDSAINYAFQQNAITIDRQQNWKGCGCDITVIAAPVDVGGDARAVVVVIMQRADNRFYLQEAYLRGDLQAGLSFKSGAFQRPGASIGELADPLKNSYAVNPDSVSKVVDENGVFIAPIRHVQDRFKNQRTGRSNENHAHGHPPFCQHGSRFAGGVARELSTFSIWHGLAKNTCRARESGFHHFAVFPFFNITSLLASANNHPNQPTPNHFPVQRKTMPTKIKNQLFALYIHKLRLFFLLPSTNMVPFCLGRALVGGSVLRIHLFSSDSLFLPSYDFLNLFSVALASGARGSSQKSQFPLFPSVQIRHLRKVS
jgi:hypothetical protein